VTGLSLQPINRWSARWLNGKDEDVPLTKRHSQPAYQPFYRRQHIVANILVLLSFVCGISGAPKANLSALMPKALHIVKRGKCYLLALTDTRQMQSAYCFTLNKGRFTPVQPTIAVRTDVIDQIRGLVRWGPEAM